MENIELQTENNNVEFLRRFFFNLKGELNEIRNHIQTDEEAKTFFNRKMREIINFHKVKTMLNDVIREADVVSPKDMVK